MDGEVLDYRIEDGVLFIEVYNADVVKDVVVECNGEQSRYEKVSAWG